MIKVCLFLLYLHKIVLCFFFLSINDLSCDKFLYKFISLKVLNNFQSGKEFYYDIASLDLGERLRSLNHVCLSLGFVQMFCERALVAFLSNFLPSIIVHEDQILWTVVWDQLLNIKPLAED